MATTYLTYTPSSAKTSDYKATLSFWVKRTELDSGTNFHGILSSNTGWDSGNGYGIGFYKDYLIWYKMNSSASNNRTHTARKFRDCSGYYHIVYKIDTTQVSANDRIKLYVNGVYEGAFTTNVDKLPAQNTAPFEFFENGDIQCIGSGQGGGGTYSGMILSHFYFIDGLAYEPTVFGSTDAITGEWKINTSPSVTYGNNGFLILKDGNTITDQSSNSNDFTLGGGTLTNTEDCPSDVFATYNRLDNYFASSTFSNGNTTIVTNSTNTTYNTSTLGIPPTMKCYWEAKFDTVQAANGEVGIVNTPTTGSAAGGGASRLYYQTYGISVNDYGAIWADNADTTITLGTLSTSDIVCFAWDGVNQALYVRKNGDAWINSGDPTSGASKTGTVKSFSGTSLTMFPAVGDQSGSHAVGTSTNFGNGYFGTTAVSSAGTNASNIGIFEYDVPTGYTALSTKGLNS
tara:strand:- start:1020 stop:2393 length:1374 start_codon:yes stop_codon:yes gene_type:complete